MPTTDVTSALEIINQIVESDSVSVETPISKQKYDITPLQGEDDLILKKSVKTNAEYVENLVKIIFKHIQNGKNVNNNEHILTYDEFIKSNSMHDLTTLIYGIVSATYKEEKELTYTCVECGKENKIKNVKYSEFKLKGKKWDKKIPFNEYRYVIEIEPSEKIKLKFITKIPTIEDNIKINKLLNKSFNPNFIEVPLIEYCLSIVDSFVIEIQTNKSKKDDNGKIQNIVETDVKEYTNIYDLKILFEKLHESILSDVKNKYTEHFSKYISYYAYDAKCTCGAINELTLIPEIKLIENLFGK